MRSAATLRETEAPSGPLFLSARQQLEAEIERLIALLDTLDGDPDLEPWLAGTDPAEGDREGGDVLDEGEPDSDSEPCLGWHVPMSDGPPLGWSYGPAGLYADGDDA